MPGPLPVLTDAWHSMMKTGRAPEEHDLADALAQWVTRMRQTDTGQVDAMTRGSNYAVKQFEWLSQGHPLFAPQAPCRNMCSHRR
jgi:hypothetical protein